MTEQNLTEENERSQIRPSVGEAKRYAERLFKAFMTERGSPQESIRLMFSLTEKEVASLTSEEIEDVTIFARHATKRLAAGAATSPINHGLVRAGKLESAFEMMPPGAVYHDLLHAAVAWKCTQGRSLIPEFAKAKNTEAQFSNPSAVQEELMVGLFDQHPFVQSAIVSNDLGETFAKYLRERLSSLSPKENKKRTTDFLALIAPLEHLKDQEPIKYYLGVYEALLPAAGIENPQEYSDGLKAAQQNRNPEYAGLFTSIFNDAKSEKPEPKHMLHEFQRMLAPLLERLRKEKEMAEKSN